MSHVTRLTDPEKRRRRSEAERASIMAEAFAPGSVEADAALRFEISTSVTYR